MVSVDLAIFTVREGALQVLLVRRPNGRDEPYPRRWALPGGVVDVALDKDLAATARRKLKEKTGVAGPYLEQLGSWGGADRDPRGWSATHVYFALIPAPEALAAGGNVREAAWFPAAELPARLAFDHGAILEAALARLRGKVEYTSLPVHLLPAEFTLSELQGVFETLLGRPLEKSAFRTRILAAEFLEEVPRRREGANRPAQLYRQKRPGEVVYFPRTFGARREG